MQTPLFISLAAAVIAFPIVLAAADQASTPNAPPREPPAASSQGARQTPDRAGTANLSSAAQAPLHDLNLARQRIPPVLLAAITNPYDRPQPLDCAEITRQIRVLSNALGADFDEPDTPQSPSLTK